MTKKNRVYNLAKELKLDINWLIKEIQKEDKAINVPSQKISNQLADKFRKRYSVKINELNQKVFNSINAKHLNQENKNPFIEIQNDFQRGYRVKKKNNPQFKQVFHKIFDGMDFEKIIKSAFNFLEAVKNGQRNYSKNKHDNFRKILNCLRETSINLNDTSKRLEIIDSLSNTEEEIFNRFKGQAKSSEALENKLYALTHNINEKALNFEIGTLEKCKRLSADQLYEYIVDCLIRLDQDENNKKQIPSSKELYLELVKILQRKFSEKVLALSTKELRTKLNTQYSRKIDILTIKIKLKFKDSSKSDLCLTKPLEQILPETEPIFETAQIRNNQQMVIDYLPWKILPIGESIFENVVSHFNELITKTHWQGKKLDEKRILKIESNLNPNRCYIGEKKFEGYVVYCFDWTNKVILECPFYGNAIYIIKGDWIEITKVSKWTARNKYSNQVTVIRHSRSWFKNLKDALKSPF